MLLLFSKAGYKFIKLKRICCLASESILIQNGYIVRLDFKHCFVCTQARKLLKLGGPGFEGHFSNKKGHLKFFSRKCWRRGRRASQKKFSGHTKKNFSRYIIFFPNMKKNFPDIPKNFPDI